MSDEREEQLNLALEKGFISPAEVNALREEACTRARSPLSLLRERDVISDETLAGLRQDLLDTPVLNKPNPAHAATLTIGSARSDSAPSETAFPVPAWERYQFVKWLGEGGMGHVFLAYDPRLHRNVALKFVRGQDPEKVQRLISEARAQARIDHERVCHVHEVGEVQGLPYIAMQYVDGQPLSAFVGKLTVAQKAALVRDAAQGIHAAHSVGLIHRDIKPSNILVEQTADGRLNPYVMDFGLARDWRAKGLTETGAVLGTPHFMAPEQARGEVSRLDWRADVYSLGATFYYLLTGKLSVPGVNVLEVLNNIATAEPTPPRRLNPKIPADLEAIVLKCLEKERSARYDSMLALIEDLDRFLAGEPVMARSTGLGYQLYKKARKHRRLLAAAAVALVAVMGALAWGVYTRVQADREAAFTRSITEKAKTIESRARLVALSPIHDTTQDREDLRKLMDELEAQIRDAGPLAARPGNYALGCGYLALGEDERAREELQAAWDGGFREPQAALALAQVMSRLYRKERLEEAKRSILRKSTEQQPSGKPQMFASQYRQKALDYLQLSHGAADGSPDWAQALISFYDEQFDQALEQLATMKAPASWVYEVRQLRGDIFRVRAAQRAGAGDFEGAREDFDEARNAYAAAAEIGRSELAIPLAQGELELTQLIMEIHHQGLTEECFSRGMEAVARASTIAPGSIEPLLLEAQLYQRMAEHKVNGRDYWKAKELSHKARIAAEEALGRAPWSSQAHLVLGQVFALEGRISALKRQDPKHLLAQALTQLGQVEVQDADYNVQLGLVFTAWAEYESGGCGNSLRYLEQGIEAYRRATLLDISLRPAWINLGKVYLLRERCPEGKEPEEDLREAGEALEQARKLGPRDHVVYYYAGRLHERAAARRLARGENPQAEWNRAREEYELAVKINDQESYLHDRLGMVYEQLAREAWRHGDSPWQLLDLAQASFQKALEVNSRFVPALINLSDVWSMRAQYRRDRGESPRPSLQEALDALKRVSDPSQQTRAFWVNQGTADVLMADFDLSQRRNPSQSLARAEEALHQRLEETQSDPQIWLYRGQLRALQAHWRASQGQGPEQDEDFEQAARDFRRAIKLAEDSYDTRKIEYQLAFGRFCCEWATWLPGASESARNARIIGIEQLQAVLKAAPKMPGTLSIQKCLSGAEPAQYSSQE